MYVYVLRLWQQETKKQRIQSDFKLQNEDRLVMTSPRDDMVAVKKYVQNLGAIKKMLDVLLT